MSRSWKIFVLKNSVTKVPRRYIISVVFSEEVNQRTTILSTLVEQVSFDSTGELLPKSINMHWALIS